MSFPVDQRPPVAVGHVRLNVGDVGAAARWLETVGLRPIVTRDELAVLELRGGTHVVVRQTEQPAPTGTAAPFDLMVDDIDAALVPLRRLEVEEAGVKGSCKLSVCHEECVTHCIIRWPGVTAGSELK